VFWHSLKRVVVTVGIDIIQYNMMPKHRSLIRYSSGICVGKENFFGHFATALLMDPQGRVGIRA